MNKIAILALGVFGMVLGVDMAKAGAWGKLKIIKCYCVCSDGTKSRLANGSTMYGHENNDELCKKIADNKSNDPTNKLAGITVTCHVECNPKYKPQKPEN